MIVNIADILRYAPKGIELYSNIYGVVYFEKVQKDKVYFKYKDKRNQKMHKGFVYSEGNAAFGSGLCNLFPSTRLTWDNWRTFLFPKSFGAVVIPVTKTYTYRMSGLGYLIAKKNMKFELYDGAGYIFNRDENCINYDDFVYASPEEAEKYFEFMNSRGKFYDPKTMQVVSGPIQEYKPKFKCGDIVQHTLTGIRYVISNVNIEKKLYNTSDDTVILFTSDNWEKVGETKPSNLSGSFQEYQRVLVRENDSEIWVPMIFSFSVKNENGKIVFVTTDGKKCYDQCIPYNEETKKLKLTKNKPPQKYIQW